MAVSTRADSQDTGYQHSRSQRPSCRLLRLSSTSPFLIPNLYTTHHTHHSQWTGQPKRSTLRMSYMLAQTRQHLPQTLRPPPNQPPPHKSPPATRSSASRSLSAPASSSAPRLSSRSSVFSRPTKSTMKSPARVMVTSRTFFGGPA